MNDAKLREDLLCQAIIAGDKEALNQASRWEVEALWKAGKLRGTTLRTEILDIVESCRESR